jgi:hypothetical protein
MTCEREWRAAGVAREQAMDGLRPRYHTGRVD